ncbi:MAG: hypothetical protein Q7I99_09295 [Acholeplasmataceae bacterium]|nr:hypothetical protein [Acholeplasmataceae bacterium]
MRCMCCGKNNTDDVLVCKNCGEILHDQLKNKFKDHKQKMSFIFLIGTIHAFAGLVLVIAGLIWNLYISLSGVIAIINSVIYFSIDGRISSLEESSRINELKEKMN